MSSTPQASIRTCCTTWSRPASCTSRRVAAITACWTRAPALSSRTPSSSCPASSAKAFWSARLSTIVGPTAIDIEDREGTNTTAEGLNDLIEKAGATVENLPIRQTITSFAGLRAHEDHHEFVIGEAEGAQQFIDCAGIESPGLTSSPAIGLHVSELMRDLMGLREKEHFIATRRGVLDPKTLSKEDYQKLIHEKPAYGQIICRCEQVTEGEILDAIHRPLGAKSLDGVKRRTRAGMGRCQAGFCSPRVMEILARELHVDQSEITKCGGASRLIVGTNKDKLEEVQDK